MNEIELIQNPTVNNPQKIIDGVEVFKKNTRYVIRFINEEFQLQLDQKILRKFIPTIIHPLISFFNYDKEYAKKYFKLYKMYLESDVHDEKMLKYIIAVLLEGFDKLKDFLDQHPSITELKKPTGKNLKQYIDIETIKHLVYFSWGMKLFSLYKFLVNYPLSHKVDKYIMRHLVKKHLEDTGLSDVLMNIVKGKVIATIKSREDIWKYLSLSIRKSPDIYISQLYNYTIQHILLFMKDAYNPIGYISNFIDRQILYIFSDVYVVEVIYCDIDDQHIRFNSLLSQTVESKMSSLFLETIYNHYDNFTVNRFLKNYTTNTNILNIMVYPVLRILFGDDNIIHLRFNHNIKIFTLYVSLLFKQDFFNFPYMSKLLTSNKYDSKKVNYRKQIRETMIINSLYNISLRNIDVLKENQVFNSVINNLNNIYYDLIGNKVFDFDFYKFISEYSKFLNILSNPESVSEIRDTLAHSNYILKKESDISQFMKKVEDKGELNE